MRNALVAAVLTGLVWTAAHPPLAVWWLVFLVVPGWLTAVSFVADRGMRAAFVVGLVTAVANFLPMLWWLAAPATPAAPIVLSLVLGTYLGVATIAVQPWIERRSVALVGPLVWTGFEVLRARWPLSGFGWGDLATAHVDGSWMLTSARVLGGDGLTLLTALLGGLAWATLRELPRAWAASEEAVDPALSPGAARAVRTFDAVRPLALGTIGVAALGTLITVGPPEPVGEVDVLVVQGSDGLARSRGQTEDLRIAEVHLEETRRAIAAGGVPDLTVWAENAVDADPEGAAGAELTPLLDEAGALTEGRLLTGLTRNGPTPGTFRNQVVQILEDGSIGASYDKIEIVPFGEYIPFRSLIGDLGPMRRVPRDAIPGTGPVTLEVAGIRVAPLICFETLFPSLVRHAVADQDAGLLVAATNDSSFGATAESAQHVAQSRLRAVETGRAVAHASIAGTSALVLPDGSLVALAPLFEVAHIRATLPVVSGATPAATVAPVLSMGLGAVFIGLLVLRGWQEVTARRRRGPDDGSETA